jgi:hypothetical protein
MANFVKECGKIESFFEMMDEKIHDPQGELVGTKRVLEKKGVYVTRSCYREIVLI